MVAYPTWCNGSTKRSQELGNTAGTNRGEKTTRYWSTIFNLTRSTGYVKKLINMRYSSTNPKMEKWKLMVDFVEGYCSHNLGLFYRFVFCFPQFRVALMLKSPQPNREPIVSAPSVPIQTEAEGLPSSAPVIVRAAAVDSCRISVSWEPGPFPNGPLLSYVLRLQGTNSQLKVYHATPEVRNIIRNIKV